MKNLNSKSQQSGSISIIFAAFISGLISIIMVQMSSSTNTVNRMHSKQKNWLQNSQNILNLSLQIKQSYNLGQLDSSCASFPNTVRRVIGGANFCLQSRNGFCITSGANPRSQQTYCASMQEDSLIWEGHPSRINRRNLSLQNEDRSPADIGSYERNNIFHPISNSLNNDSELPRLRPDQGQSGIAQVIEPSRIISGSSTPVHRINIPPRSQSLWVSCANSGLCVQVNLCEEGVTNCTKENAVASQIIRLGALN